MLCLNDLIIIIITWSTAIPVYSAKTQMARSKYHIFHSTFIDQLSEKIELMLCLAFSYIFLCNLINQLQRLKSGTAGHILRAFCVHTPVILIYGLMRKNIFWELYLFMKFAWFSKEYAVQMFIAIIASFRFILFCFHFFFGVCLKWPILSPFIWYVAYINVFISVSESL